MAEKRQKGVYVTHEYFIAYDGIDDEERALVAAKDLANSPLKVPFADFIGATRRKGAREV